MTNLLWQDNKWKAELSRLNQNVIEAHNLCHDWYMEHPEKELPKELNLRLLIAEANVEVHKDIARQQYFVELSHGRVK